ncbi:hypothetical protein CgunFtcFv8_027364 [Champsocephalus gunnari]|uniref:SH2 domain-containing protein n=1 Tax=Champsocephalus gunnari TaxID=52237 RepID=A0AAN8DXX5_CHAGU|nr:hypothetical protein CgunFtcFv8_027364 [Champsocephalus gunnari]
MERQHESLVWFKGSQVRAVVRNGVVPEWFHGIISRNMSEELLMSRSQGYFLIRVSESRIGYTLSCRTEDRCRHFMIDALEDGQYIIVGEDLRHRGLQELIDFHRRTPIMPYSEVLTVACGQRSNHKSDYAELLFPPKPVHTHFSWMENNSKHPSSTLPTSEEEIPPALPRRDTMRNSAVLSPNRLYPNLSEDHPFITPPLPATPVTRKRSDNPPSNQRPEVPARSPFPPARQNQASIRTVSAPGTPLAPTATPPHMSATMQSAKIQEAKLLVVSNLKNLKKKFQKIGRPLPESLAEESSGVTENEYQEITGKHAVIESPYSLAYDDDGLPYEYLPPPPFAPGYYTPPPPSAPLENIVPMDPTGRGGRNTTEASTNKDRAIDN